MDAPVGSWDTVTVIARMTAAVASDASLTVYPYDSDGVTLMGTGLPPVPNVGFGETPKSGEDQAVAKYDVMGIDKVQIVVTNNSGNPQTASVSWRVEAY
jgi:hypothetical protein